MPPPPPEGISPQGILAETPDCPLKKVPSSPSCSNWRITQAESWTKARLMVLLPCTSQDALLCRSFKNIHPLKIIAFPQIFSCRDQIVHLCILPLNCPWLLSGNLRFIWVESAFFLSWPFISYRARPFLCFPGIVFWTQSSRVFSYGISHDGRYEIIHSGSVQSKPLFRQILLNWKIPLRGLLPSVLSPRVWACSELVLPGCSVIHPIGPVFSFSDQIPWMSQVFS